MKLNLVMYFFLIAVSIEVKAQDPVFTQYFLVPETLNPGFTGFQYDWRAGILHRRQWPDGNRVIDTDYGFVNTMVAEHAGIGMSILNNHEAFTNYNFFQINGDFSYTVEIDNEWSFRPGMEVGFGRKDFNFGNLVLEDQININTGAIGSGSIDPGVLNYSDYIKFADISAGFVIDNEEGWFGASLKHLNRPNISFTGNSNVPLDLFLSIHGGYAFDMDWSPSSLFPEKTRLLLTANYMRQSQYNRLDFGTALMFENLTFGATAVFNPERKSNYSHALTSVNPFILVHFNNFNFGYSYDMNTSSIGHTQGIHELSLTWHFKICLPCFNKKNKFYEYNGNKS